MKRAVEVLAAVALCALLACGESGQRQPGGTKSDASKTVVPSQTPAPATTPATGMTSASQAAASLPAPDASKGVVVRYGVVLEGASGGPRAPENLTFATGSRFKLVLMPSADLYIYLIHQGTDGSYALLQPMPGQATSIDRLAAARTQDIPLSGWFRFDAQAGTEKIYLVAAPNKVERMEQLLEQAAPDSAAIGQALAGLQQRQEAGYTINKQVGAEFSELAATGERAKSAVIIGLIELRHK